jgi:hypothetical protein
MCFKGCRRKTGPDIILATVLRQNKGDWCITAACASAWRARVSICHLSTPAHAPVAQPKAINAIGSVLSTVVRKGLSQVDLMKNDRSTSCRLHKMHEMHAAQHKYLHFATRAFACRRILRGG